MKKLLKVSSVLALVAGVLLVVGGLWGIGFTYKNIVREKIVTSADATIPGKPVRGPFTLKAQADVIRKHVLDMTDGKTFAEMPRQVPQLNEDGEVVMDTAGQPVLVANTARDIWITATTLTTALNLAILAYVFFGLFVFCGLVSVWLGMVFLMLSRNQV